ncbi:glycosyltransferase family 4 protein [Vagococcus elongatus]|uniref:1,2-diacylglycerol 3-glucosyltransferase n=1 Tax=Vagococcus elongatus TaxID=180344 RepID=A0A430ARR0_9ENTE|nr:glycosyltransferase family 4 protein [Vagococcus elongatus]RSU10737.1 1,2-diacylglycerol 3-glucosyltransferase [Vagococcus elongatus]
MRIGLFTDTYFPQVSGVATSIKTLKIELEKLGHEVIVFTTTDPQAKDEDPTIVRLPSIPFISFKERRIMISGMADAYEWVKHHHLDIIHTHTEFGVGWLGKYIGKKLNIPVVHTYHTMYEEYLHYIAKGKLIKPSHVKQATLAFSRGLSGIVCPSQRVVKKMKEYGVRAPLRVIPTGIEVSKFYTREAQLPETNIREQLKITEDDILLLSLSRISYEKNIQGIIKGLPKILEEMPGVTLMIVGNGPYKAALEELVAGLSLTHAVKFIGEVPNDQVRNFYQTADFFVSASSSESQGLTFIEALATGTKVIAKENDYLKQLLSSDELGRTFREDQDFPEALIHFCSEQLPLRQETYEAKIIEISSERFAENVLNFYDIAKKYHQLMVEIKASISLPHQLKIMAPKSFFLKRPKDEK